MCVNLWVGIGERYMCKVITKTSRSVGRKPYEYPRKDININLGDGTFKSQKKFYNRVHERLESFESFTFILRWEPHDEQICPSSIAKYLVERGVKVETCTPKLATRRQLALQIPQPDIQQINSLEEWMGMIAIGGDLNPENDFVSSYQCDTRCTAKGYITAFHISGLFTPKFILELREWLRENVLNKKVCQWIGVTVQCFTDAPNLKRLKEKKSCPPEDSLLTFIMNENKNEIVSSCFKLY